MSEQRFTLRVPLRRDIGDAFQVGGSMGYDGHTWTVVEIRGLTLTVRRRLDASDRYDHLVGSETRRIHLEPTA